MSAQTYLIFLVLTIPLAAAISIFLTAYQTAKGKYIQKFMTEHASDLKLDISVKEMIDSEERILNFFKCNELQPGSSIVEIAAKLKIKGGSKRDDIADRALLNPPDQNGEMTVDFKSGISDEDQLFDFAHECGHVINGDLAPATRPDGQGKSQKEQLADYTGAALLMPIDSVYDFLNEHRFKKSSSRQKIDIVHKLCQKYTVSEVIALRRINEVYAVKDQQKSMRESR